MDVGVMVTSYNHGDWERLMADDYSRPPTIADPVMVDETLAIGEMVEPLGYDSIWTTEDYGSAYSMRLSPLQWLAYWAGRTSRVDLGTAVVVAPWWNPVRLAHEISVLDVLLRGRNLLLGFGRGVSEHEYASLRVPRGESSDYFHEIVDIPRLADRRERFTYDGEIFKIPATTIRPQPRHKGHLLDPARPPVRVTVGTSAGAGAGAGAQLTTGMLLRAVAAQREPVHAELSVDLDPVAYWEQLEQTTSGGGSPEPRLQRVGAFPLAARTVSEEERRAVIAARLPVQAWPDADLRLTAVDVADGRLATFDRSSGVDLVDAVAASCAVPGVWPAVTIGGRRYMDAGTRSPTDPSIPPGAALPSTPAWPQVAPLSCG